MLFSLFIRKPFFTLALLAFFGIIPHKSNSMEPHYLTIPQETHVQITDYLTIKDLISLSRTCNHLINLENKKDVWKKRITNLKLKLSFYEELRNIETPDAQYIDHLKMVYYATQNFKEAVQYLTDNVSCTYDTRCRSILNISLKKPASEIENYLEINFATCPYIERDMDIDWLLICFNIAYEFIKNNSRCYDDTKNSMLHHYWVTWRGQLVQKSQPDALYWSIYSSKTSYSYPDLKIHHAEKQHTEGYNLDQPLVDIIPFLENPIPKNTLEIYYEEIYKHKKFLRLDKLYSEYIETIPAEDRSDLLNTRLREMKEALIG